MSIQSIRNLKLGSNYIKFDNNNKDNDKSLSISIITFSLKLI